MKLQRAKLLVVLMTLAGFAFVIAAGMILVVPALRAVRALADEITAAQTELEAQYANRHGLLSSIEEIRRVRENMDKLSAQFIPEKQELSFITATESVAAKHGVEQRIRLSNKGGALPELNRSFELSLSGSFPAIMNTLLDLERLPNLMIFESLNLSSLGSGGPETSVSATLRGSIATPPKGL